MIVGLYVITPFLRKIVEDYQLMKYFLVVSLIFTSIVPLLMKVDFIKEWFQKPYSQINFYFTLGYSGYFVLGYFLNLKEQTKKQCWAIYIMSIIGFIATIIGTRLISYGKGKADTMLYANLYPTILLESIGVFIFVKSRHWKMNHTVEKVVKALSKYSFGVYLVHALVLWALKRMGLTTLSYNPIVSVLIIFVIVSIISLAISMVLNRIPLIKKYIV